jgi:GTP-binding protein
VDEILDLFIELGANETQLDFPVVYTAARAGIAKMQMTDESENLQPLFDLLIQEIPMPEGEENSPLQIMVTTIDHDEYVGRIAIGRVVRGRVKEGQTVSVLHRDAESKQRINLLYVYEGLKRKEVETAMIGDIIAITGLEEFTIGDTLADPENPETLPTINIDEPTLSMMFMVNNSPFAGKEGQFVTSRHLRERLLKEKETNVSLRIRETDSPDTFEVCGRGELHLAVLIETMRREGYEFAVGKPQVIYKEIKGKKCEPLELLTVDVPQEFMGAVMDQLGTQRAEMVNMVELAGYLRLEFIVPARGLIGFRSQFLTNTKGNGIMHHVFHGYAPYKGEIPGRTRGALVAFETGETCAYGIFNIQDRGVMFIVPGQKVYTGMIVGENTRELDMDINPCKKKQMTNTRTSSADEALRLITPRIMSLEECLEHINDDELVEVTPKSLRLRKAVLDRAQRGRNRKNAQHD